VLLQLKICVLLEHIVTLVSTNALSAVTLLQVNIKMKQAQQAAKFVQLVMNALKLPSPSAHHKITVLTTIVLEINELESLVLMAPTTTKMPLLL
jgi:uncharacterized protein YwbE